MSSSQREGYSKGIGTNISMRGSIIRVDSPVIGARKLSQGGDSQQTPAYRTPLGEVSPGMAINGASPTTLLDSRRLTMPPLAASLRKVSGERTDTPTRQNIEPHTPTTYSENDSPSWSAIGHASTSGKSGRVIEKLMAENDKLKREVELQLLRSQELERNLQTMRPQLEALRAESSNFSHLKSVDASLLSRRDRKIETLKEELAAEQSRRETSENHMRQTIAERDTALELARREVQQAQDEAKHSSVHASILEQSHRQLASEYRTRAERFRQDIQQIETDRKADSSKLARLEVVEEQMRTELERSRKLNNDIDEKFSRYRQSTDRWRSELEEIATRETSRSKALSDDMETVVNKMRWVMSNHTAQLKGIE